MRYLIYILSILTISSCIPKEKELEIDPIDPEIVIFNQLIPEQAMIVAVARTFSVLENGFNPNNMGGDSSLVSEELLQKILVKGAQITISYAGQTDTLFEFQSGLYASLNTLQTTGLTYELHVIDFEQNLEIKAQEKMLEKVEFKNVNGYINSDGRLQVDYSFDDLPGSNYYMINTYRQVDTSDVSGIDVNSIFSNGQNELTDTKIFNDKTFESSSVTGSFVIENFDPSGNDSIAISLSNISQKYYSYLEKRKKSQNLFTEIFKEPVNYPTNVVIGKGFFTTHHPHITYFKLN